MSAIISGSSPSVQFSDGTTQSTSAIVSGYVPYANLPAGSVLQVVNATYSTTQTTSSASAQPSNLTASITPRSASNKILISLSFVGGQNYSGRSAFFYLYKNGSQVLRYELFLNTVSIMPVAINYVDSPATTSSTTYALYFSADGLGPAVVFNGNTVGSIILQEIAG